MGPVIFIVVLVVLIAAVCVFSGTADVSRLFGRTGLPSADDTPPAPRRNGAGTDLEAQVRALLTARNERRIRDGEEPLDVDAEVRRRLGDL